MVNNQSNAGARLKVRCEKLGKWLPRILARCIEDEYVATALFGFWNGEVFGWRSNERIEQSLASNICVKLGQQVKAEKNGLIIQSFVDHPEFRIFAVCTSPSTKQARLAASECLRQVVNAAKVRVSEDDKELPDELFEGMYCSQLWIEHQAILEVVAALLDKCLFEATQKPPYFGASRNFISLLKGVLSAREESRAASGTLAYTPDSHARLFDNKAFLNADGWNLRYSPKHVAKLLLGTPNGFELAVSEDRVLGFIPSRNNRAIRAVFNKSSCTVGFREKELFYITTSGPTTRDPHWVPTRGMLRKWSGGKLNVGGALRLQQLVLRVHERAHGGTLLLEDYDALSGMRCHSIGGLGVADPESLAAFTEVDGAVLLRWDMTCHGLGGLLFESCHENCKIDYSRGSRYNSALNYSWQHPNALLLVFSADGGLTILKGGERVFPSRPDRPNLLKKLTELTLVR